MLDASFVNVHSTLCKPWGYSCGFYAIACVCLDFLKPQHKPQSPYSAHLLNYSAKLIVILTLTLLVITEKDSAPLNDELCV